MVENAYAETQSVERNAFVDAMEHAGKVQVFGKSQWRETETTDAERGERLRVRAPREAVRNRPRLGVVRLKRTLHRRDQRPVVLRLHGDVVMHELPGHVVAQQVVDDREELLLMTRQKAPVHLGGRGLRDDVR